MKCTYAWTDFEGEHFCQMYAGFKVLDEDDPFEDFTDGDPSCGNHVGNTVRNWGGQALVKVIA